ncbi:MAG: efflux RND transporter permease subunit [bacterium]
MNIVKLSVTRPVTIIMIFLLCVLMGIISWSKLSRELFPPLSFPQLNIVTVYPNAAPEEIENLITKIIEEAIGTVKNLKRISSVSKEGASVVTAEFSWNTNMNFASLWVREKLDQVKEQLPPESKEPVVMAYNPFSEPVVLLNVTSQMKPSELLQICKKIIKDRIEKTEGVAAVEISGGEEQEIRVDVDQGKLQAAQLSLTKIVDAVKNTNINYPAGTTEEKMLEYLVRTIGEYRSLSDIGHTVIETSDYQSQSYKYRKKREEGKDFKKHARHVMRLSEVADISWQVKDKTSYSRYNGVENISIAVRKRSEANTIRTSARVGRVVENLRATLKPHHVSVEIIYDQAEFIKKSINGLMMNAVQGGLLAFIVILYFLKSFRMAVVVSIAIPVSILMSLACMFIFKLTINMMSLGGLALGVGMLVDNAIVVIENIFRHSSKNKTMSEASITGTEEVAASITSSTLTSVAVFLPLIFIMGIAGQVFKELSLTVIFSLTASLFVALSLIPRLTSTSGKPKNMSIIQADDKLAPYYRSVLLKILENKKIFLSGVSAAFIISLLAAGFIGKSFLPKIDQGQFIMHIDLPVGTRLTVTNRITGKIEQMLAQNAQIKNMMTQVGSASEKAVETLKSYQAQIVVTLFRSKKEIPQDNAQQPKHIYSTPDMIEFIREDLTKLNLEGGRVTFTMQDSLFKSIAKKSSPIVIEVKGSDMDVLARMTDEITLHLKNIHGVVNINDDRPLASPETKINVDKDKASVSNLSVADIARTGMIGLKGMAASSFKQDGMEYDIRVRLREEDRTNTASLENLLVQAPEGFNLYLRQVAKIVSGVGPSQIRRINQQRTITIYADLTGISLKKATEKLSQILDGYSDKIGYSASLSGETAKIRESFLSLLSALILALVLVYMIMASQFESLYQPFIILFTIPLALIGVVIALIITHTSINAISLMGFIILGGIVVNNGIVLIDYTNELRAQLIPLREAVIRAGETRLRPILMTMSTTVLGLLPLALGIGEGAELRSPMAITVIGGLLISTLLTLCVIPVIYISLEEWREKRKA